jgi:hypothetical protein
VHRWDTHDVDFEVTEVLSFMAAASAVALAAFVAFRVRPRVEVDGAAAEGGATVVSARLRCESWQESRLETKGD